MDEDRGSIKWAPMMLAEHTALLKEYKESLKKIAKPQLDEQKYKEFNDTIASAIQHKTTLKFGYYQQGIVINHTGKIKRLNPLNKTLEVMTREKTIITLYLENIVEIILI